MENISALAVIVSLFLCGCTPNFPPATPPTPTVTQPADTGPVEPVATTLLSNLDTPWQIAFAPDGRMFFTERSGQVRTFHNGELKTWLKLDGVLERGEAGLLGIALDPAFQENGYAYMAYSYAGSGGSIMNRLARYKEDPASKTGSFDKILIDAIPGNDNHDGGFVKFGPDGKLYWAVGDRFQGELSQKLDSLNGKILRLNADGSIPADNPFDGSYVWSYGHRNVQGMAWDPVSGNMYATEHGPSGGQGCCNDEVNRIEKGKNYGWPTIRGTQEKEGLITPIATSGDTVTWAPAGIVYIPSGPWKNSLLFTGLRGVGLYRAVLDESKTTVTTVEKYFDQEYGRLRAIALASDGKIYIGTSNRDGRGQPNEGDDRILVVTLESKK